MPNSNHSYYLEKTFKLSTQSVENGNHPFGAILVINDKVVCTSENEVNTLNDITAHAELRLIQKAQKILSKEELSRSTIYSSTEPCAMCSGAIYWAGIKKVYFGCSAIDLYNIVKGGLNISSSSIFKDATEAPSSSIIYNSKFKEQHIIFWI